MYDPYLYSGKFTTSSRKAAGVVVSGNNVYVSESSFKTYANAKNYWIFSNDEGEGNPNAISTSSSSSSSSSSETSVNYTRYVSTSSANLNVRTSASSSASIKTSLAKGTEVTVTKVSGSWSYISSPTTGWVSSAYLSSTKVSTTSSSSSSSSSSTNYSTTVGNSYTLKSKTTLYSKGSLSGTTYSYLAGTSVKVISHYSSTIDYVYIAKTGRYAYCKVSAFTSSSSSSSSSTSSSSSSSSTTTKYVTVSVLNVRKGAGTSYSVVKTLTKGTKVTVYATSGNWSRIGTNQWVYSSYLSSSSSSSTSSSNSSSSTTKKTVYTGSSLKLNVRKGPGTSYSVVKTLTNGTSVTVYATSNGWSRIGTNQWVKSACLK